MGTSQQVQSTPAAKAMPGTERLAFDGARLFVERARVAASELALAPEDADAVAEICRRLGALPLAIELAAARVRLLPPPARCWRASSTPYRC